MEMAKKLVVRMRVGRYWRYLYGGVFATRMAHNTLVT
jgi:hypothetical protein